MPELPEVETIRHQLDLALAGSTVEAVTVHDPLLTACCEPGRVEEIVTGRRISGVRRRGKYLLFALDPPAILAIHLRMTGSLLMSDGDPGRVRLTLDTSAGRVLLCDTRRLGTAWAGEGGELPTGVTRLGPEPWDPDLTRGALMEALSRRRSPIKASLLDQKVVAGIGNIYADESLWQAGIHPCRPARSLSRSECERLLDAVRAVLERALRAGGTTFSDYRDSAGREGRFQHTLGVYGRTGSPCPACGTTIERTVVAGRGTHYCPGCQEHKRRFDNCPGG